jgi:hypothetical protein
MTDSSGREKKTIDWSDPELRELLNQALAVEFIKAKKPEAKANWLEALNSATVAALVTVCFGTILGAFLSSVIQEKSRKNDAALATYKEYLERERGVVEKVFQVVGTLEDAADNMIALTGDDFDIRNVSGKRREEVEGIRLEVIRAYNTADAHWHEQQMQLGLEMAIEHQNDAAVISAWQDVSVDLTDLSDCAKRWPNTHPTPVDASQQKAACGQFRGKLDKDLRALTQGIVTARSLAASTVNAHR